MDRPDALPYKETLGDAIHWLAAKYPDRKLMVNRELSLTFEQAERESARIAKGLLARGLGKGSRVGILFGNRPEFVTAFFAAARIGAVVSPINTFVKAPELVWQLRHGDVQALITSDRFLSHDYLARLGEGFPGLEGARPGALHLPEAPYLRSIFVSGATAPAWAESVDALTSEGETVDDGLLSEVEDCATPSDLLCVLYTSGSTADPKGVVHAHGPFLRRTASIGRAYDVRDVDVMFNPAPFFWTGGLINGLFSTILNGATLLVEDKFDAGETLAYLERERVTMAMAWPHFGIEMERHPSFPEHDLSSIRGGTLFNLLPKDKVPEDLGLLTTGIGMTETIGQHTYPNGYPNSEPVPERLRGAFGVPAPGVEQKIVDADTGETCPEGEEGELWLRGYSILQGYYKREREDVFTPDGWFRTGDLGLHKEGFFFFTGRLGDMIKTAGANVAPPEVQREIMQIDGVQEAHVMGIDDSEKGQTVAAAIVCKPGTTLAADDIKSALRERLSAFKVPKVIRFLAPGEVPMLPTDKLDKRGLKAMLAENA